MKHKITIDNRTHEKLETLKNEYNKKHYAPELVEANGMTIARAIDYLILRYEHNEDTIEPGMFNQNKERKHE